MNTDKKVWDWRAYILHYGPDNAICRHILLTLSCYMDSSGEGCYPSITKLTEVTRLSRPSVIKYLEMAHKEGWVRVEQHGYAGQKWKRNEYTATIPEKLVNDVYRLKEEGGKSDTEGGKSQSKKVVNEVYSTSSVNNSPKNSPNYSANGENSELPKQQKPRKEKEPPNSDSPPTLFPPEPEPTFEEFWEKYQKKIDTAKCKTKWRRLKSEEKQAIMDHLDEYIPATPDKQYRRNPLTYLNNRTWEDEELPTFGGRNGRLPVHDTTKNAAGRHERTGFDQ